jgi:hypothetical protein
MIGGGGQHFAHHAGEIFDEEIVLHQPGIKLSGGDGSLLAAREEGMHRGPLPSLSMDFHQVLAGQSHRYILIVDVAPHSIAKGCPAQEHPPQR